MTEKPNLLSLIAKSAFLLILLRASIILITRADTHIFIDGVNLLIHEAGHWIFYPFGKFISILGGTLMQLIIPSLFILYFLRRVDYFAVLFSTFWLGENFINISYYISDAKDRLLPLVGNSGMHDWAYILPKINLLNHAKSLGNIVFWAGGFIMILALVCTTVYITYEFIKYLESRSFNNSS